MKINNVDFYFDYITILKANEIPFEFHTAHKMLSIIVGFLKIFRSFSKWIILDNFRNFFKWNIWHS